MNFEATHAWCAAHIITHSTNQTSHMSTYTRFECYCAYVNYCCDESAARVAVGVYTITECGEYILDWFECDLELQLIC